MRAVLVLAMLVSCGWNYGEESATLRMLNGDTVEGRLQKWDRGYLHFQPTWSQTELRIPLAYMGNLTLPDSPQTPQTPPEPTFWASCHGGDRMLVGIHSLSGLQAELTPPWGGRLGVPVNRLVSLERAPSAPEILIGGLYPSTAWSVESFAQVPGPQPDLAPFQFTTQGVLFRQPMFLRQAYAATPPTRFMVELTLPDQYLPQIGFDPLHPRLDRDGPGMMVTFMPYNQQLWVRGRRSNFNAGLRALTPGQSERIFRFYFDLEASQLLVTANGQVVGNTQIPIVASREGTSFRLHASMSGLLLKNIRVLAWDGTPPSLEDSRPIPAGSASVTLMNGKVITGIIGAGRVDGLQITSDQEGAISLPWADIRLIRFAEQMEWRPRRNTRDVQVETRFQGGTLMLKLQSIDPQNLRGDSEVWGKDLQLPLASVRRIEFNPHASWRLDREPDPAPFPSYSHGNAQR